MHNVTNRENEFYLYDYTNGHTYFIGTEEDLVKELVRCCRKSWVDGSYSNYYYGQENVTGNDCFRSFNWRTRKYEYYLRPYLFYDGYGRNIDIKKYEKEVYDIFKKDEKVASPWYRPIVKQDHRKKKKSQPRKHHSAYNRSYCWKDQTKDKRQWEHRSRLKAKRLYVEKNFHLEVLFL